MILKKIFTVTICSLLLVTSSTTMALAAETKPIPAEVHINYNSAVENVDGTTTYDVINANEIASYYGINNPKEVTVTLFNRESSPISAPRSIYINNIKGPNEGCGAKEITRNSAYNSSNKTIKKTIALTGSVSNTYSTNVSGGINVDIASISAGVGFDVTDSWQMSDSTEVELAPGESVNVYAYPLYDFYNFDIINDPIFGSAQKIGTGSAGECKGFCTVVS